MSIAAGFLAVGIFLDNGCSNYSVHNNITSDVDVALKLNSPTTTSSSNTTT